MFLVGAFPLREKCPTIAVTVFSRRFSIKGKMPNYSSDLFFLFFLQTTILTLIRPLFTILSRAPEAKSAQGKLYSKGSPLSFFTFSRKHTKPDVPKGSPLWIFFGTVRLFFPKFFCLQRVPPFIFYFFNVTYKTGRASRVPPLDFFRHRATFFENFLMSPKGPPFEFFDILQRNVC